MKKMTRILFTLLIVLIIAGSGLFIADLVQAQGQPPIYFPIFYYNLDRYYALWVGWGNG